jgi:hypothetical protein
MSKFNKNGSFEEGYLPIYKHPTGYTKVLKTSTIDSMKNLHSFCTCNSLPAGRIAKLQGGYYLLNDENEWEFLCGSLNGMTYEILLIGFSKITSIKSKVLGSLNNKT